jgi:hypothetical protein
MARRFWSQPTTARRARAQRGRRHQRLHFDQERPRAFDAANTAVPGAKVALGQEQRRRVCHLLQAAAGHLEHADLVGRSEPVLDGTQDPEQMRAFALEGSTASTMCSTTRGPAIWPSLE